MRTKKPHGGSAASPGSPLPSWSDVLHASPNELAAARKLLARSLPLPLNPDVVSARNFVRRPAMTQVLRVATTRSGRTAFLDPQGLVVANTASDMLLSRTLVDTLHRYQGVSLSSGGTAGPIELVRLAAQLVLAGVPTVAASLPTSVEDVLGPQISTLLRELTPQDLTTQGRRVDWSLRARREGFRAFTGLWSARTNQPVTAVIVWEGGDLNQLLSDLEHQSWPIRTVLVLGEDGEIPAPTVTSSLNVDHLTGPISIEHVAALSPLVLLLSSQHRAAPDLVADLVIAQVVERESLVQIAEAGTYLEAINVTSYRDPGTARSDASSPPILANHRHINGFVRMPIRPGTGASVLNRQVVDVLVAGTKEPYLEQILHHQHAQVAGAPFSNVAPATSVKSYFSG